MGALMEQVRWGAEWQAPLDALLDFAGHAGATVTLDATLAAAYGIIFGASFYLIVSRRLSWVGSSIAALVAVISAFATAGKVMLGFGLAPGVIWLEPAVAVMPYVSLVVAAAVALPVVVWTARRPSPLRLQREIDAQLLTLKELRSERAVLERQVSARTSQLQETTQRFETFLRQSPVSVFSQDANLRYTWVRNPPPSFPSDVIGKTDREFLPAETAERISDLKTRAMASGKGVRSEIVIDTEGEPRWYDLTVELVRAADGSVVGTTSAAVDITHRRRNEELLQMLLKEVTHRSKNLLAIIHAIVRHANLRRGSENEFAERLGARLRALAVTHDLLVEANWRGVSVPTLLAAQITARAQCRRGQISANGPDISVTPNAADTIGFMVHELLANAVEHGSLSVPAGRVEISWQLVNNGADDHLMLRWEEHGGPPVREPADMGFGRWLLDKAIGMALTAETKLVFAADGVRYEAILPSFHVVSSLPLPNGRTPPEGPPR